MIRKVATSTNTPMGRLTKKIQRQSNAVTSSPPRVGPAIVAAPDTAPQMPKAAPRRSISHNGRGFNGGVMSSYGLFIAFGVHMVTEHHRLAERKRSSDDGCISGRRRISV